MLRIFIYAAIALTIAAFGFAWYALSPLLYDNEVSEELVSISDDQILGEGDLQGVDRFHQGAGQVQLVRLSDGQIEIRFTNFNVTNGPDLEVWLSSHPQPMEESHVTDNTWLDLGRLKGNVGDQAYILPADADLTEINSVTIWCEQFGVLFASAPLTNL